MQHVVGRHGGVAEKERVALIEHALAYLCAEEGNPRFFDELLEHYRGALAVGRGPYQQQRSLGVFDLLHGTDHGLVLGNRSPDAILRIELCALNIFVGDVFRQLEMYTTCSFLLSKTKGFTHTRGNIFAADNLVCVFGQGFHHLDDIDDLETSLFAGLDRLLTGDHQHRHGPKLRVSGWRDDVRRSRAQSRQAYSCLTGEPAVGGSHEAGSLLVTCQVPV